MTYLYEYIHPRHESEIAEYRRYQWVLSILLWTCKSSQQEQMITYIHQCKSVPHITHICIILTRSELYLEILMLMQYCIEKMNKKAIFTEKQYLSSSMTWKQISVLQIVLHDYDIAPLQILTITRASAHCNSCWYYVFMWWTVTEWNSDQHLQQYHSMWHLSKDIREKTLWICGIWRIGIFQSEQSFRVLPHFVTSGGNVPFLLPTARDRVTHNHYRLMINLCAGHFYINK